MASLFPESWETMSRSRGRGISPSHRGGTTLVARNSSCLLSRIAPLGGDGSPSEPVKAALSMVRPHRGSARSDPGNRASAPHYTTWTDIGKATGRLNVTSPQIVRLGADRSSRCAVAPHRSMISTRTARSAPRSRSCPAPAVGQRRRASPRRRSRHCSRRNEMAERLVRRGDLRGRVLQRDELLRRQGRREICVVSGQGRTHCLSRR
jgi:hypothetical protein